MSSSSADRWHSLEVRRPARKFLLLIHAVITSKLLTHRPEWLTSTSGGALYGLTTESTDNKLNPAEISNSISCVHEGHT